MEAQKNQPRYKFTYEDGAKLIDDLIHDKQAWGRFLGEERVQKILGKAIAKSPLRGRVLAQDLGNAVYLYTTVDNASWLTSEKKNPGGIYYYFALTVRSLLKNRTFVKNYLGFDLKVATNPIVDDPPAPNEDELFAPIAEQRVKEFEEIILQVWESHMVYGELLYRYYVVMDDARIIAKDFLHRGLMKTADYDGSSISERILDAAENNLQTRKLNLAREEFNKIAAIHNFPYKLNGKVKKTAMRKLHQP